MKKAGWYRYNTNAGAIFCGSTREECIERVNEDSLLGMTKVNEIISVGDTEMIVIANGERIVLKWLPDGHSEASGLSFGDMRRVFANELLGDAFHYDNGSKK